jgi:hypothetical protein
MKHAYWIDNGDQQTFRPGDSTFKHVPQTLEFAIHKIGALCQSAPSHKLQPPWCSRVGYAPAMGIKLRRSDTPCLPMARISILNPSGFL